MEGVCANHQAIRTVVLFGRTTFTRFNVAYELFMPPEKVHRCLELTVERTKRSRRALQLADKSVSRLVVGRSGTSSCA